MSEFMAVSAFKTDSTDRVVAAISQHLKTYGVRSAFVSTMPGPNDRTDAQVYLPVSGWTVVLWPEYFNTHDFRLVRDVAATTNWLISSVHVYDSQYWEHLCLVGIRELQVYNSQPSFWKSESPEDFERISNYESDPSRLALQIGVPVRDIEAYFVPADALDDPKMKAYADDECALGNFWVFTDFWRRIGITYPDVLKGMAGILRIAPDFAD